MKLLAAIRKAIKASGKRPYTWAVEAGIPKSTFRSLMLSGHCSGRTLALLQAAGVAVADPKLIASLDQGAPRPAA